MVSRPVIPMLDISQNPERVSNILRSSTLTIRASGIWSASARCSGWTRALRVGSYGNDVARLQIRVSGYPGYAGRISVDGAVVGAVGEVDPAVLEAYDIEDRVAWLEVADGSRSLAHRLRFQAADRTLTDAEVGEARAAVIAAVESTLPARLRG